MNPWYWPLGIGVHEPHAAKTASAVVGQCSFTCGSVRRVMSRASVSSATFV